MKKWAMITGATGEMGKAYIKEFLKKDCNLILIGRSQDKLEILKEELKDSKQDVRFLSCDSRSNEQINEVYTYIQKQEIKLSYLCNVTGIENEGLFSDVLLDDILDIIRINVESTIHFTKKALECKAEKLYIINVSSLAAMYPIPYKATYASSKRFLVEFTRIINYELRNEDVNVSVVCPAGMPTRNEIVEKIKSQGFFGKITTVDTRKVCEMSLKGVEKGKVVMIPGFINRLSYHCSNIIPTAILIKILGKRWKKSYTKLK